MATTRIGPSPGRLLFIDNLRWVSIVLVVTMHAAVTYSNFGRWYFMEPAPKDRLTLLFFGLYQSHLQAWFMGFLFLLAGYFVPAAFDRKGPRKFIADRAFRLGLPSLFYMLAIHPFIVWFMLPLYRTGQTPAFRAAWLRYIARFRFLDGTGPMWFAVALLLFSLVYAGYRLVSADAPPGGPRRLPGHTAVVGLMLAIAVCTFLVRTVQPIGTAVLNMQLCFFSQYAILFAIGILAYRGDWLARIPYRFGLRWWMAALVAGPLLWLAIVIGGGALSGVSTKVFDGGWHWQSAANAAWESFYCVGTCLGLTVLFREKCNAQGSWARWVSGNAFSIYVFHTPVLIAVTMAMHPYPAPPVVRFLVASVLAFTFTLLASSLVFRRIPLLKQVL
jgi:glucans biosynthesis protein C